MEQTFTLTGTAAFNYTQTSGNNLYVNSNRLRCATNGTDQWFRLDNKRCHNITLTSPTVTVGVTGETGSVSAAFNTSANSDGDGDIYVYATAATMDRFY